MSSSESTRPSSRPRDGYFREQRLDAVLDVLGAHRPRGTQPRRSVDSCGNECRTHSRELRRLSLSFGAGARHGGRSGHSQTKARRSGDSCGDDRIRTQIDHLTRMTTEHDDPEQTSARSREAEQSKA